MPIAAESASARLCQELTKKVCDRGLVLWVDAERQYEALPSSTSAKAGTYVRHAGSSRELSRSMLNVRVRDGGYRQLSRKLDDRRSNDRRSRG